MAERRKNESDREHAGKQQHEASRSGSSQQKDDSGRGSEHGSEART